MAEATALGAEIAKFDALAARWWDPNGPMKPLHRMNPVRIGWIAERLAGALGRKPGGAAPLAGLRVLDVGCGAGLASEALARLGADVTGMDAAPEALEVARAHAEATGVKLGQVAQPLRAALTGKASSPPLFEMLALLGREESLIRLRAYIG